MFFLFSEINAGFSLSLMSSRAFLGPEKLSAPALGLLGRFPLNLGLVGFFTARTEFWQLFIAFRDLFVNLEAFLLSWLELVARLKCLLRDLWRLPQTLLTWQNP